MKYVAPFDAPGEDDPYVNADPAQGQEGSRVPAAGLEHPQREIVNVITAAGLQPDEADLTQLTQAIPILGGGGGMSVSPRMVVREVRASGDFGGVPSAFGAWADRQINTVISNDIGGASFNTGTITLPVGIFEITAKQFFLGSSSTRQRLFDVTNAVAAVDGLNHFSNASTADQTNLFNGIVPLASGRYEVLLTPADFKLQYLVFNALAGAGTLGQPLNVAGESEVYAEVIIDKIA